MTEIEPGWYRIRISWSNPDSSREVTYCEEAITGYEDMQRAITRCKLAFTRKAIKDSTNVTYSYLSSFSDYNDKEYDLN